MDPRILKKWLALIAVVYLVFPRDLTPDFLGRGLGLVDDLLLIALLTYFYRNRLRGYAARGSRQRVRNVSLVRRELPLWAGEFLRVRSRHGSQEAAFMSNIANA
jgi:uncharacterized membrane protein YkvA (DUF1232 family)